MNKSEIKPEKDKSRPSSDILVKVKTQSGSFNEKVPSTMTILELIDIVTGRLNLDKRSQKKILHNGEVLESDQTLSSLDLVDGVELELVQTKREWKLTIGRNTVSFSEPEVSVSDALTKAGFDISKNWLVFLIISGQKHQKEMSDIIDLRNPEIEKLRVTPAEVIDGEGPMGLHRQFRLLDKDEDYLNCCGIAWETKGEGKERWLFVRAFAVPSGYNLSSVDIAILIPSEYPYTQLDSFYCFPSLVLSDGSQIGNIGTNVIESKNYQFWSRHLNGVTRWNPDTDSVITHLAVVEESLEKELRHDTTL